MKQLSTILTFLLFSSTLLGQIKVFEPEISDFPNLNADSIKKFEELCKEYHNIVDKDIPFDSLSNRQKLLLEDELLYEAGPYFTGTMGCSWYCATGPKELTATSELDSNKTSNYKADNSHDFDLRTAWVEGKPDYGIGEEIKIEFKLFADLKVTHVEIYNGYCKNEKSWKENSRVKTLALYTNGQFLGNLSLANLYQRQRFKIGSFGGDKDGKLILTFKIIEVYKGEKYMDTAISEINFDGTGDH